jgi:hypothetical protein
MELLPPEKRVKFFVFVIESPSDHDLYNDISEGDILKEAIKLDRISCVKKVTITRIAFEACLKFGIRDEMGLHQGQIPIIHISCHGAESGIQLSNNEVINWEELSKLLAPLNKALNGSLLLCMSSCKGFAACKMAMRVDEPDSPFFAVVGSSGEPTWSDTAVAYASFYHLIAKGALIVDAVKAMNVATGVGNFVQTTASEARKSFLEALAKINTVQVRKELDESSKNDPQVDLVKGLKQL